MIFAVLKVWLICRP